MVSVRTARMTDLAALCGLRYADQPAIHRDRIYATDNQTYSYLVAEQGDTLVGFGVLLLERPPQWSDPLNSFPIAVDLFVSEHHRSQGIGRTLLAYMERLAREHGKTALYLTVEPVANPRALALYQRLGFQPLQQEPYHNVWRFTDSEGIERIGEERVIDMRKPLTAISSEQIFLSHKPQPNNRFPSDGLAEAILKVCAGSPAIPIYGTHQ